MEMYLCDKKKESRTNLREGPRSHLLHLHKQSLPAPEHVVFLFNFPKNCCHQEKEEETSEIIGKDQKEIVFSSRIFLSALICDILGGGKIEEKEEAKKRKEKKSQLSLR